MSDPVLELSVIKHKKVEPELFPFLKLLVSHLTLFLSFA
jgi:hypothetical protein